MNHKTVAVTVVVLIILYSLTVRVSESNWACGTCHTAEHTGWLASTHKTADCTECHIDPGLGGAIDAQINGVTNLFVAVTQGTDIQPHEDPLPISTENCRSCHAAILMVNEIGFEDLPENSLKGQSLKIGHRIHVEKHKIDCVECHRGIVHRNPEEIGKYKTNWPLMHKDCNPCHNGQHMERFDMVLLDTYDQKSCLVCHPTYIPPPESYDGTDR